MHLKFTPYFHPTANICANISLFATLTVGIINFGWVSLHYTGSDFHYGIAGRLAQNWATLELVFTGLVPVGIILFFFIQNLWLNCFKG